MRLHQRVPLAPAAASLGLLLLLGALGDSAAVPGLGAHTWYPPWDLAAGASSALVSVIAAAAWLLGAVAVWLGWRTEPSRLPSSRTLLLLGLGAAAVLTLVPSAGSADHLSYLAYGRIAAAGQDPYSLAPSAFHGGLDPVAGAVQPPWRDTPSVYGPLATGVFAAVARLGDGSLRLSAWLWSLVCLLAFAAVAVMLHSTARDERTRRRVALTWALNPLLLGQLVLGAHVDTLATAFALGALLLAPQVALPAGLLLGAAVAVKAPYALYGLAVLWALRRRSPDQLWRVLTGGLFGAALVLVPAHAVAGPHVFDQLGTASGFTSIASPWRGLVNLIELATGPGSLRHVVTPLALLAAAALAWLLARRFGIAGAASSPSRPVRTEAQDAALAALALTAAWTVAAPYALPWYDAMVWAPLALVLATGSLAGRSFSRLGELLLAHLAVLSLAYVPGRVVGLSATVQTLTLGFRRYVAPVAVLVIVVALVRWATSRPARAPVP